jgi:hypothetical protein
MPYINKHVLTLGFLYLTGLNAFSQNNFKSLGESAIAINHKVSKDYSVNFAFRSRYFLYDDYIRYQQQQVDVYHFSTFKLNFSHKLSFGVYYRNRDWFEASGSDELRFTEQFNYIKQRLGVRYGHRFRAEQRILNKKNFFRQRYRFAVDFPLNGEKLDIGETYLVNAAEGLLSLSEFGKPETDIRISAQIGWQIHENLKLQTGLEHRLEAFNLVAKNNVFVLTSAILKI